MSILKIKDLVHKYVTYGDTEEDKQEIAAINHIDINVEKGEFVAILGKNGSGKSSLAKHINCLLYTSPSPRDLSTSRMPSSA